MRTTALITALLSGIGLLTPAPAHSQSPKRPSVEFALLSSVNFLIQYYQDIRCEESWDWPPVVHCEEGLEDHYTAVTFPSVSPGLRVTFWSTSPVLIDAAFSWMKVELEDRYVDDNFMFELGVGADLARSEGTEHPFAGLIGGLVVMDGGDPIPYLGAQLGLRHFIRDYAALRFQLGYRATINSSEADLRAIEVAAGIGFFL